MMTPASLKGRIILVVEDEYFIADEMGRVFASGGAQVLGPVGRLEDALALIEETAHIDGAVLDINLHDVNVYPAADALHARGVPFVFATGYEQPTIPSRFFNVQRCEKPVEPGAIASALFG